MKLKMFCVYDSKVEAYLSPFFMKSKGEALRAWQQSVNDAETMFCKFPSDFTLFEIGEFDENSGQVTTFDAKISLGLALEFKNKPQEQLGLLEKVSS